MKPLVDVGQGNPYLSGNNPGGSRLWGGADGSRSSQLEVVAPCGVGSPGGQGESLPHAVFWGKAWFCLAGLTQCFSLSLFQVTGGSRDESFGPRLMPALAIKMINKSREFLLHPPRPLLCPPPLPSPACVWRRALLLGDPQQGWSQGPRSLHLNPGPSGGKVAVGCSSRRDFLRVRRVSPAQPRGSEPLRVASAAMPARFGDRLTGLRWGLQPLRLAGVLFGCSPFFACKHSPVPTHTWFSFLSLLRLPCHRPPRAQHLLALVWGWGCVPVCGRLCPSLVCPLRAPCQHPRCSSRCPSHPRVSVRNTGWSAGAGTRKNNMFVSLLTQTVPVGTRKRGGELSAWPNKPLWFGLLPLEEPLFLGTVPAGPPPLPGDVAGHGESAAWMEALAKVKPSGRRICQDVLRARGDAAASSGPAGPGCFVPRGAVPAGSRV